MSAASQLSRPEPQIVVKAFRKYVKNSLQGFLTLSLPAVGLTIKDISLHESNGSRWVSMPARPYETGGQTQWSQIIEHDSKESRKAFQNAAIRAVDAFQLTGSANPEPEERPRW